MRRQYAKDRGHPRRRHLCVGRVSITDAIRSLNNDAMRSSPLVIGLQWLALNLERVPQLLR